MKDFDITYEKMWHGATQETRTKSRRHWLDIYEAARKGGNTDLLQMAEHVLAMQVWLESREANNDAE